MKYAYYPGCSLHATAKEYNLSMRAVCNHIGIDLIEIPDWICCGSSPAHMTSHWLSLSLAIANCTWAEKQGLDIVAPCAACFSRLKVANLEVKKDTVLRKKVNHLINEEYEGKVEIINPLLLFNRLDVLGKIKNAIKRELSNLNVACYYGCLLSRPQEISREDNCEQPAKMDRIIASLKTTSCNWTCKTECCGASLAITQPNIALRLACDILNSALENGADCIAVACPLCQSNLDLRQPEISKKLGHEVRIPIVYFTQLIGLAMNLHEETIGLKHLVTAPFNLFEKKGLLTTVDR
jgi:heterodisulfide reductase subunit B